MHVHTLSSPDAELPAAELSRAGESLGVGRIGFVAHLDMHPDDFCFGGFHEQNYMDELSRASENTCVKVLRGIEIGEPHIYMEQASACFTKEKYDFLTGALHWIGKDLILNEKPFQTEDPLELVERYYRENLLIAASGQVNILAHLGIFRRGMARAGLSTDIHEIQLFPELLKQLFTAMIDTGTALEVNTAGLRRPERTTYPSGEVISMYRATGGERITLGSDTHLREHAFFGLKEGIDIIHSCHFNEYGVFNQGDYLPSPLQM